MKQGSPAPNLAVGEAETTKRENVDDYEAVSFCAAGLTWKINKWHQGFHFKQLQSLCPESEHMSQELPVLIAKSMQPYKDVLPNEKM